VGDQGAAAGLELSQGFGNGAWSLSPFVFGDVGVAANNGRIPAPPNYQAASYGLGLRGGWGSNSSFELGWAIPSGGFPQSTERSGPAHSIVYFRASLTF
jgi:hemolysin activation/secretion protein